MEWTKTGQLALAAANKKHKDAIGAMAAKDLPLAVTLLTAELGYRRQALPQSHPTIINALVLLSEAHRLAGQRHEARERTSLTLCGSTN